MSRYRKKSNPGPIVSRRHFLRLAGVGAASLLVMSCHSQEPAATPVANTGSGPAPASKKLLFVGGYTSPEQPGIHAFLFDSATGQLSPAGSYTGIKNPSFLTLHPNGKWLYAVSETGLGPDGSHGAVWAFHYERDPVNIEPLNQRSTDGDWPCHVQLDGSGRWLVASNYGTGNAAMYPIQADGTLGEMTAFVQHEGRGPNTARQEGPHAHSATFTPDNRYLIVADLGIDQLVIYRFDEETGSLTKHGTAETHAGAGPRHLAFHPSGKQVYVANELDSSVTLFTYDAAAGTLLAAQTLDTLPAADPKSTVADIHLSPDAQHLYISNRGHNSIAVFAVGEDGRLRRLAISSCGGNWPRNFALAPDGRYMLVANRHGNQVSVLPITAGGGEIGKAASQTTVTQPSCVRFVG